MNEFIRGFQAELLAAIGHRALEYIEKRIVFCKDCVCRDPEDKKCDGPFMGKGGILPMDDLDFCSCGQRKENRDENTQV